MKGLVETAAEASFWPDPSLRRVRLHVHVEGPWFTCTQSCLRCT